MATLSNVDRTYSALFCGSRRLNCVDPRSAIAVIGSFGFVEKSGASFEQVGLEECKDRRAPRPREIDGLNVALVTAFPAVDLRTEKDIAGGLAVQLQRFGESCW